MHSDDFYAFSPSTHAVPHSPFLLKSSRSPAPHVPDIDTVNRRLGYSGSHFDQRHNVPSPLIQSQNSQFDSQPQCIPATPCINNTVNEDEPAKRRKRTSETPVEQVVPSCSPYVDLEEKPSTSHPCSQDVPVPDEKPRSNKKSVTSNKRQNRNIVMENKSPDIKEINFFTGDEIFG